MYFQCQIVLAKSALEPYMHQVQDYHTFTGLLPVGGLVVKCVVCLRRHILPFFRTHRSLGETYEQTTEL